MIKHYTTLKPKFKNKNVYVWDVGIRCLDVFSRLACRGINIKGFVTNIKEYTGATICSRPVISTEEFSADEKGVVVVHDAVSPRTFNLVCEYGDAYRYSDVLDINEELAHKSYYIYGTGAKAWQIIKEVSDRDMHLKGFLRSRVVNGEQIMGIPVNVPNDVIHDPQDLTIIDARDQKQNMEMLETLCKCGYKGDIYIREILPVFNRWGTDPFWMLNNAAHRRKKLILCCEEEIGSSWIHSVLDMYRFKVTKEVCFEGSAQRGIEDIWSLADQDPDKCVLLIFALNPDKRADIIDAAKALGFTEESGNYAGIQECCYNREHSAGPILYEKDNRLHCSLDYSPVGGLPGWALYGNGEKAKKKILVLGGSTSSEVYITENWVSRLHRMCIEHGFSTAIYNGAYEGNMALDELIRLTRGLQNIKPDIVISMSGFNDFAPVLNKFEAHFGENSGEHWRRIESYMKAITESAGSKFFAFLQPMNTFVRGSVDDALMFTCEGHHNRKKDMTDMFSSNDFYYNIIDLLQHKKSMFIDAVHYSGSGHEEIAGYVFEKIKGELA